MRRHRNHIIAIVPWPRHPMRKDEEFSEWYNGVIDRAELSDKRYPIKGMNVWRPYGWAIMKLIDQAMREEFDSTGHGEVNFPVLIPETEFQKEADHVKGFEGDVFWVTRGGLNELDVKLVLRPTSETAMYPMFRLWIRSHADLPLKVYQIVPVFRYETKMTRTFMRVREIHFFEAHTAHATYEDAEQQIQEDLQINERIMRLLCLPYLISRRPDWDKFPGAYYSLGTDTLLPSGRAAQVATFHQYRDNFAKNVVTAVRRDTGEKRELPREGLPERLRSVLELMQVAMWDRADKLMKDNTFTITSLADARDGFNRMGWCGKESCGKAIGEKTGMSVLGTPFYPEPFDGKCIVCGERTKQVVYAAKAY